MLEPAWIIKGEDVITDHRRVILKNGYPTMDDRRDKGTDGFYRHGMLGRYIGLGHTWAKLSRIDLAALLTGKVDSPERAEALDRLSRFKGAARGGRIFCRGFARRAAEMRVGAG